jgi:hypothetical protein
MTVLITYDILAILRQVLIHTIHKDYGQLRYDETGHGVGAVFLADIPTVCILEMKRQKPRSTARMSENTVPGLNAPTLMNNAG